MDYGGRYAFGYLDWAVMQARGWVIEDAEVLRRLKDEDYEDLDVVGEVSRRLGGWSLDQHKVVADWLVELERENRRPGKRAQRIDRLLRGIVRELAPEAGRPLAETCVRSPRLLRRIGAWRFFVLHEPDWASAEVVADQARGELRPELIRLVANSHEVVGRLNVHDMLARLEEFYWRGRLLQTMVEKGNTGALVELSVDYPAEAIYAIRRAGRPDLVNVVRTLLGDNPDHAEVVANAIRAFAAFGCQRDLKVAYDRGQRLLASRCSWYEPRDGSVRVIL